MPIAFVNGKRVNLPSSNVTPADIVKATGKNADPSTRAIIRTTTNGNERLKSDRGIQVKSGDKFQIGPDRVKGAGESYFGNKEQWRKDVIIDQVMDLSQHFFKGGKVELDDDCNWVTFDNFKLPDAWARVNPEYPFVKMMLIFPDQFPDLPTNGFYLPNHIVPPPADSHFYDRGYSGAFGGNHDEMEALAGSGWKWYCTHIKPGAWSPARIRKVGDWRYGDNLWDVITLCKEVLTNPRED